MKVRFLIVAVFGICIAAISIPELAAASRRTVGTGMVTGSIPHTILDTSTAEELYHVVAERNYRQEQDVGCRAQQERRLVPTLCFRPEMDPSIREVLVARCFALLKSAIVIPESNKWTDPRCVEATIQRKRDLEYSQY